MGNPPRSERPLPLYAQRIRLERERHAWTQKQLADELVTNTLTISRWELGKARPGSYFQQKLCEVFGKNAEEMGFVPVESIPVTPPTHPKIPILPIVIVILLILGGIAGFFVYHAKQVTDINTQATSTAQTQMQETATTNSTHTVQTATVQAANATATVQAANATATAIAAPRVTILSPTNGSHDGSPITVMGIASNIPAGKDLWLFVTAPGVYGYFPQTNDATHPSPITVEGGGTWSVTATIGTSADLGKTFTLIPALVDQKSQAENAIYNFFKQSGQPYYVAIQLPPSGIQLMMQVSVIRM